MPDAVKPWVGAQLISLLLLLLSPDTSNQRGVKIAEQRAKLMLPPRRARVQMRFPMPNPQEENSREGLGGYKD